MKQTITLTDFMRGFEELGRGHYFSREGFQVLFDYLEEIEEGIGEEMEFDPIGLCCNFSEASPEDIAIDYGLNVNGLDPLALKEVVVRFLEDEGRLIAALENGRILYRTA